MKKFSAMVLTTALVACISTASRAGGVYNPDHYNAYRQMERSNEQPMVAPPGPSRPWNYRDEEGFTHRCRQYGYTIDCED